MQSSTRHILFMGSSLGAISLLYFLSLVAHLPFVVTVPVVVVALYLIYRWMFKGHQHEPLAFNQWSFGLLLAGIAILIDKSQIIATKHGLWDAWAIWNLHSVYLTDAAHWQNIFLNIKDGHPDYPLALPATLAFFSKLVGSFHWLIPYALHFFVMLCIPVLIYLETNRKSLLVAGLSLLFFVINKFYITQGMSQLADTMLAFFFLCAFICYEHGKADRRMLILSAAFLGLCMWTKNEGAVLAGVFILFHFKELVPHWKYVLAGLGIPLAVWLLFKIGYAPANDMLQGQSADTLQMLLEPKRYAIIYTSLVKNLNEHFKWLKYLTIFYLLYCALRRKRPDKRVTLILTCLLAYFMVYVISPQDLEWHLFTSQSRLMHQLIPALVYVFALKFAGSGTKTITRSTFQARFFSNRQLPR